MSEKINEKIAKLKRLLADGSGASDNEKQIARNILKKYEEMGIDIDSDEDELKRREFPFKGTKANEEKTRLLFIILRNFIEPDVFDERRVLVNKWYNVEVELTQAEHIEAMERFVFYWRHYQEQKKENELVFIRAFIGKNNLWSIPSEKKEKYKPTKEDLDRDLKAMVLQQTIEKAEYNVRLQAPK